MRQGRLILLCGLPGAGKTTLAKILATERGGLRLCPDEWMASLGIDLFDSSARARVEGLQWELARTWLSAGHEVIIEWGTWGRSERDELRLGARALGALVELRYLDAPLETLLERVTSRGEESPPLTLADLREADAVFQRPDLAELALFDRPNDEP